MKRILTLLTTSVLVLSFNTATIFAAENLSSKPSDNITQESMQLTSDTEVSQLFLNYINSALENQSELVVTDPSGLDITRGFIEIANEDIKNNDYKHIRKVIQEQNLSIAYSETSKNEQLNIQNKSSLASVSGESVSKKFYHIATDTSGKWRKEWVTTVSGTFSYGSTFKINSTSNAAINLTTANFGAGFSASLNNVSTSSSYSGYVATFKASYKMKASLSIPIGNVNGIVTYDFGDYIDAFNASPSAMQN
ncbi:hypothetical protein [Paenibacillus sp. SN-8-1]|uniref:hypothetical protein n=1 Tax=Paenibacillus sp. SN-8-1 TaxID=3435409 RepID=UPI003D9A12B3